MQSASVTFALLVISTLLAAKTACAQCVGWWLDGPEQFGVDGPVYTSIEWDPDGAGPRGPLTVIGGAFSRAGNALATNIAAFDPQTGSWSGFGAGVSGGTSPSVRALAVLNTGELVAGGDFTSAGGVGANHIARWNGTAWAPLGNGVLLNGGLGVRALEVATNGDLLVGGGFYAPGPCVARWNGSAWSRFGTGANLNGTVYDIEVLPNGDVIAAGSVQSTTGVGVLRWDGAAWVGFGTGVLGRVAAIKRMPNGDLVAGGAFTWAGGIAAYNIARWDGTQWNTYRPMLTNAVESLVVLPNGDLVVAGIFPQRVARWTGSSWVNLGTDVSGGTVPVRTLLHRADGSLFAGGDLVLVGGRYASGVAVMRDDQWSTLHAPTAEMRPTSILASSPLGDGCVAGGVFSVNGGAPANYVARWENGAWAPVGGSANGAIRAVLVASNGDVFAAGDFTLIGQTTANRIARWNGTGWQPITSGLNGAAAAIAQAPNGDIFVGGAFTSAGGSGANRVARWNGTAWSPLGTGVSGSPSGEPSVASLLQMPSGDLIVGGRFTSAGGTSAIGIARWNGSAWSAIGSGFSYLRSWINALVATPDGGFIAGGENAIAYWTGAYWYPLGTGPYGSPSPSPGVLPAVNALAVLPNGDIIAGGSFTVMGGLPSVGIARWDGDAWSPLSANVRGTTPVVRTLAISTRGELLAGGDFAGVGTNASPGFARFVLADPPTAAQHPEHASLDVGGNFSLTAAPQAGLLDVTVQWYRDGLPIHDGPGGASSGGGTVQGSAPALSNPTDGAPVTLTLTGAQQSDRGSYTAVFTNACGSRSSNGAVVRIGSCPADFNGDLAVDADDTIAFFAAWDAGNPAADFNSDGGVDGDDVIGFFGRWDAGC